MKIVDTHAHIFPSKIAEKAKSNIGRFYNMTMQGDGATSEQLIASGNQIGVVKYIVHSTATTRAQVENINDFIINETHKHSDVFVGFATLHPEMSMQDIEKEVERAISNGLKGIKLHPDFQKFDIDCDDAEKIYDAVEGKLPILFHTGDARYEFSAPEKLAKIAKKHPKLTVVGAHFGGYSRWDEVGCYKGLDNVLFDTSSTLFKLPCDRASKLVKELGIDKFMFGVDFPMWKHTDELQRFLRLDLTENEKEQILWKNAKERFNIEI